MDSEHNPEQASHTKPTIEKIKTWDADELLEWIQQQEPNPLKGDKLEKFKAADILGRAFLMKAGNVEFFEEKCHLPIGTSLVLADLAREIMEGETADMVQKEKEQDTSTGKSTDHAPLLFSLY
jgi:hypothetical protein